MCLAEALLRVPDAATADDLIDDKILGGLRSFYLLMDEPEVYGLPSNPKVPSRSVPRSSFWSIVTAAFTALGVLFAFRERTTRAEEEGDH